MQAKKKAKENSNDLKQWQKQALDPITKFVNVVWLIDEQGHMTVVTPEQFKQEVSQLEAQGDGAVKDYLQKIKAVRAKNRRIVRNKRAADAITMLFAWAIATEWCDYNESLSPEEQREMLETFCDEALQGIKQTRIRKARYVIITKAYDFAKPYLIRFRKKRGIPNNKPLSEEQGKEVWREIASKQGWKRLVKQKEKKSGKNERESHRALRAGVNSRWREEFSKTAKDIVE